MTKCDKGEKEVELYNSSGIPYPVIRSGMKI